MFSRPRLGTLKRLLALWLAVSVCFSATASDLDKEVVFHISPQPLESALLEFSRQADVQVAMASASIRDVQVSGVDGKLPVGTALLLLLRGSGLSYSIAGSTLTVTRVSVTEFAAPAARDARVKRRR
jgi:hypothetical protein